MNDDLKKIPSAEWRQHEKRMREWVLSEHTSAWNFAYGSATDACKKMAEEAEGREKCAAGLTR